MWPTSTNFKLIKKSSQFKLSHIMQVTLLTVHFFLKFREGGGTLGTTRVPSSLYFPEFFLLGMAVVLFFLNVDRTKSKDNCPNFLTDYGLEFMVY